MTPKDLTTYGEALYGPRWQSELARDLEVSARTMRYWVSGDKPIPDRVADEIRALRKARIAALRELK